MSKKSVRKKHVPQRTCVGCREVLSKQALIRIVRLPDGITVDLTGKKAGRGAYLHDKRSCWERSLQGALAHALKVELTAKDKETLLTFLSSLPDDSLARETT